MADGDNDQELRALVARLAAAYFTSSHVSPTEISSVIRHIADGLSGVGSAPEATTEEAAVQPAPTRDQIRRSIRPDALISFEDGKPHKTLKLHLAARGLTPEQYRAKWGLPEDYPMVAASHSKARAKLAKALGLAQLGQRARLSGATRRNASRGGKGRRL